MTDKLVLTFVCGRNQNISNDLVKVSEKNESAKFFACELWVERVGTIGVVLYRNQLLVNFNLHFGELRSNNSINDKNNLFENHIPKSYKVKRILISFNMFSEYIIYTCKDEYFFDLISDLCT